MEAINRIVEKAHPELTGNLHLPRRAQVVKVRETSKQGAIADPYRPHYAATLRILDEHGEPDPNIPELHDVPMSLPSAGHESGDFAYPEDGAHVVVGFIDGSPNNPVIQGVLPHGRSLPELKRGEKRRQHSAGNYDGFDADGNAVKHTAGTSTEDSLKRIITALENLETYTQSLRNVEADDTETVGGIKAIKAMGGAKYHSGGKTEMLSAEKQHLASPKTWLGSEGENVLGLLSELMAQVIQLANVLSSHTHPTVGAITQAAAVTAVKTEVTNIKGRLDPIKE
jgi:Type VI secretion system/phage-baseplate injector OB domain